MLDSNGFRPNVGIILCNGEGKLFWAKRIGQDAWQFPQGGIKRTETPEQALFRELNEEVGLGRDDVEILHETSDWLRYRLPQNFIRQHSGPVCIGQKQKWFLLALQSDDNSVHLNRTCEPEFDDWCWVNYWHPVNQVINFKRDVYRKALTELESALNSYVKSR
jgi:putative (di)nucleoside polyphosphate hydrolase|tara:strand:+ start:998 stop:1486 length:489 start_codon:yes stop_codon:yes gene_type:complete